MAEALELPVNCTLAAMNERDRALHEARLKLLRQSASKPKIESGGFSFTVCLTKMPQEELVAWTVAEQGCCSFLRITQEVDKTRGLAEVKVTCPPKYRREVMRTFGLKD